MDKRSLHSIQLQEQQSFIDKPLSSLESLKNNSDEKINDEYPLESLSLANTESNSHSISGEFNLASLSSDSGIQKGVDDMSSVKTSDNEKSPKKSNDDLANVNSNYNDNDKKNDDCDSDDSDNIGLKRSNSVKARANLFQQLENRYKEEKQFSPILKRGEIYIMDNLLNNFLDPLFLSSMQQRKCAFLRSNLC